MDIDECATVNCNGLCINGHGSYVCQCDSENCETQITCMDGLKPFGYTCIDIDECTTGRVFTGKKICRICSRNNQRLNLESRNEIDF